MSVDNQIQVGPATLSDGAQAPLRGGRSGELIASELNGRYYEQSVRKNMFWARAIVTAPVIFSTAAGTGGPLLWNGTSNINAVLLGITVSATVVTTVAAALGITGGTGQTVAPTSTTAIDTTTNCYIGGPASQCTAYRIGTPAAAGAFFIPLLDVHTGALTVDTKGMGFIDLGGSIVVPPNCWASIAASATATTLVAQMGLLWAELPV